MRLPGFFDIRKSIQGKIFFSFILVILLPSITISASSYVISVNILKEKISHSFSQTVLYVTNSVDRELKQVKQISDYIFVDSDIKNAIQSESLKEYEKIKQKEQVEQTLRNYSIANTFRNINVIKIYGTNHFLLSFNLDDIVRNYDDEKIIKSQHYKKAMEINGQILWAGLQESYSRYPESQNRTNDISLFRAIKNQDYNAIIGMMYISLQPKVFSQLVDNFEPIDSSKIYIVDNNNKVINKQLAGDEAEEIRDILDLDLRSENMYFTENRKMVSYYHIQDFNWKVIGVIPIDRLTKDNRQIIYITILAFIVSFIFSCVIWYFISSGIVRPIKRLTRTVDRVKEGDLQVKVDVSTRDEIGKLSNNFNYMIERINQLFEEVIQKHARIKDAEYKALQAQINPHFLYNTLNSIRWMAMIHKADNIKRVVDSLGRLLKSSTSKTDQFITIEEEIKNLEDYIYIQKVAYGDKFEVDWKIDSEVFQYKCIKFILQPLVENAIFHGIEPKKGVGTIIISAAKEEDVIIFNVRDDGMGMTEEQIGSILEGNEHKSGRFSGIGISNINERIKMTYGAAYGLKIQSVLGCYTNIELIIPILF